MRKKVCLMFIIMVQLFCLMLFVSCDAITAQNININSRSGMNGGQRGDRGQGDNDGGPAKNDDNHGVNGEDAGMSRNAGNNGNFKGKMMNGNLMGKIISVEGNSIKIELIELTQNNESSNSSNGSQDANNNNNKNGNNNRQSQRSKGGIPEINYTGIEKTLVINDDVNISKGINIGQQKDKSNPSIKISDLKKDQIIMIWYKENTETIERINIIES